MPYAAKLGDLAQVFRQVFSVALTLIGLVALVMLLIGGFQYIGAGGDKEAAARARGTLTYAIIGLILAISAWLIINLLYFFLGLPGAGVFNICITGSGVNCTPP